MGKLLQENCYILLLLFRPDRLCTHLFIYFPIIFATATKRFSGLIFLARFLWKGKSLRALYFYRPTSLKLRRAYFLSLLLAAPYEALAKYGGERGIRTLDAPFETYMISNHAPSTAQTPLLYPMLHSISHGDPVKEVRIF